jgi:Haem-binding domain
MNTSDAKAENTPTESASSFFRTNQGLLYLTLIAALPAFVLSLMIGLNPGFTAVLLVLFFLVAYGIDRLRSRGGPATRKGLGSITGTGVLAAIAVFVLIQAVPYGRSHSNGKIVAEPKWPNDRIRSLVVRACYDCHSNEVTYPAYANVAPISWLVQDHVSSGRSSVNFSNFRGGGEGADNVIETIERGSMPPGYFTRFGLHKRAKLSKAEITELIAALKAMPEFQGRGG